MVPATPDSGSLANRVHAFAVAELGPASALRCTDPLACDQIGIWIDQDGLTLEDAVLRFIHGEAKEDRILADEFFNYFLVQMHRLGHFLVDSGLRRYLDTGDLVNSVAAGLWQDLRRIEFRDRTSFLAYLRNRLKWKKFDRVRGLDAAKRSEQRRASADVDALTAADPGPATLMGGEEDRQRLLLAIARLDERDRCLVQGALRGDSAQQLGDKVGLKPDSAQRALRRAVERARRLV